jgi:hypothetical protein
MSASRDDPRPKIQWHHEPAQVVTTTNGKMRLSAACPVRLLCRTLEVSRAGFYAWHTWHATHIVLELLGGISDLGSAASSLGVRTPRAR